MARRLNLENLESRQMMATFGVPWHDASRLTLSFAPDGAKIAGHSSDLFAAMDAQATRAVWQGAILKAFETWGREANLNFGLHADSGAAFGILGPSQGDDRFGDIRVGAQSMSSDVLSISVPHDPFLAGTWAGDMLLNSDKIFSDVPTELLAIALHEAGHVLGLRHSDRTDSVMFSHANGLTALSAGDIADIRALYGRRGPDANEGSNGNDSFARATQIKFSQVSDGYDGSTPLIMFGDIGSTTDADYFSLRPLLGYSGPVSLRVRTSGLSLLAPRVTLYDSAGQVLRQAEVTGAEGGDLTLKLDVMDPHGIFLRVEGRNQEGFGIGRYGVVATFDGRLTVPKAKIDALLVSNVDTLQKQDFDEILADPNTATFNDDLHTDDTFLLAASPKSTPGYLKNSHYEWIANLSDAADLDFSSIKSPTTAPGSATVMTVSLRAMKFNGVLPRISVFDRNMQPLAAKVLVHDAGRLTVELAGLEQNKGYFVKLGPGEGAHALGNYAVAIDYGTTTAPLTPMADGALDSAVRNHGDTLYIARAQLFQFTLGVDAVTATPGTTVKMTLVDELGKVVLALTTAIGETFSSPAVLLTPGKYTVKFVVKTADGSAPGSVNYHLAGAALSEPIGPALEDPTLTPRYVSPSNPALYLYPNGVLSLIPFLFVLRH